MRVTAIAVPCEDRVLDGPASGGKGSKGSNQLDRIRGVCRAPGRCRTGGHAYLTHQEAHPPGTLIQPPAGPRFLRMACSRPYVQGYLTHKKHPTP